MYAPYGEELLNQKVTGAYHTAYTFTDKERDPETGYLHFDARNYIDVLGIWTRPDPLLDQYIENTAYAYCDGNPIKYVDPIGEWIAVTSNDDTGIAYRIVGGAIDVDDCNVYIVGDDYNMDRDGKPQGANVLGQTATPYSFSFYNQKTEKDDFAFGSIINMNDKSGDAFLARFENDEIPFVLYLLPPCLSNVSGWNKGKCDFKYGGDENSGIPLAILGGKIGTARDIGNFAAGYIAAVNGRTFRASMNAMDVFQNLKNNCTTGEPPVSRSAQMLGFRYGWAARFANRVCQPNIYNGYH